MMLFYTAERNRIVEPLERMVAAQLPAEQVMSFRSFKAFAQRLRKPRHDLDIILMAVSSAEEMARISELQHLLSDLRLVLILPGRDPQAIAWAHKLAPRFIAYADNGFEQVGAVLVKMMRRPRKRKSD